MTRVEPATLRSTPFWVSWGAQTCHSHLTFGFSDFDGNQLSHLSSHYHHRHRRPAYPAYSRPRPLFQLLVNLQQSSIPRQSVFKWVLWRSSQLFPSVLGFCCHFPETVDTTHYSCGPWILARSTADLSLILSITSIKHCTKRWLVDIDLTGHQS